MTITTIAKLVAQSDNQRIKALDAVNAYIESAKTTGAKFNAAGLEAGKYIASLWTVEQKIINDKKATVDIIKQAKQSRFEADKAFKDEIAQLISDATGIKYDSARRAILRDVEKHTATVTGFKKAVAQTTEAINKRKQREQKAPAKKAPVKSTAPAKVTASSAKLALAESLETWYDSTVKMLRGDQTKELTALMATFTKSVGVVLNSKAPATK